MSAVVTLRQLPTDVGEIARQLLEHFLSARQALADGSAVVVEVGEADLLGHGTAPDAATACAMLGLARALAIEGSSRGWSINVVTRGGEAGTDATALVDEGLTGQLLHAEPLHLGRLPS